MEGPVTLLGEKEIKKIMSGLPDKLSYKIILATERKAARHLVKNAKQKAPVASRTTNEWWGRRRKDKPAVRIHPETLKRSIGVVKIKTGKDFPTIMIGPRRGKRFKYDGWFGVFPEYGTKGYRIKKGKFKGRYMKGQKAKPYMSPAFASSREDMLREMTQGIGDVAQKFIKKYAK
jgi:hypothetical protein